MPSNAKAPLRFRSKIRTAVTARRDIVIVARTDAVASEGFDAAVARAKRYVAVGVDAIFPEALTDASMFTGFARAMPGVPLFANMTEFGRTPMLSADAFEQLGYKMVIGPVTSLRAAAKAYEKVYATLKRDGSIAVMLPQLQTREELYRAIRCHEFEAPDQTIAKTIL